MNKVALFCLCLGLLAGCTPQVDPVPLYPPQTGKTDAAKKAFFARIHYPYYASNERRRRIERIVRGLDNIQTPAQVLAELGPPDWKDEVAGYPPTIPPSQGWFYVHTLERPLGPRYEGKLIIIIVDKMTTPELGSIINVGLQKVDR